MRHILAVAALGLLLPRSAVAADVEVKMDEETRKATAKALEWLASKQNPDGSWSDGRYPNNTAITAYAMLAFMAQGHLPRQGLYGPEVAKGARFLLSSARDDGYIVGAKGGNMYCHAMATLALLELWGMTGDDEIKPVVKKAVDLIIRCQSEREGGWRYEPVASGADISITIMQVMALRAARNSGLHVPDATMKRAIAYIESCWDRPSGGFRYQPNARAPAFARTAAGACVLMLAGQYNNDKIRPALEFLHKNFDAREHYWYGHYYAAHAMHTAGGKDWEKWYGQLVKTLLPAQSQDGSWVNGKIQDPNSPGPVFSTSIAVVVLSVPANYLPIFQR
jgi:squalene cyclase